jgi:hypothetical protein
MHRRARNIIVVIQDCVTFSHSDVVTVADVIVSVDGGVSICSLKEPEAWALSYVRNDQYRR